MMPKLNLLLFISGWTVLMTGQNLPGEFSFSPDGLHLTQGGTEVKGLYNDQKIRRIDLIFDQPNWKNLLTQNYNSKTDIPATCKIDGISYPNVGVRYKGQTSYQRVTTDKKSFNITLDFSDPEQHVEGYQTLNLNNSFEDNSYMREVFYENFTRKYGPSLKACYVHLYINGEDYGLYPHVQALDGTYIKEWFLSNSGTRWRCERTSGNQPGQPGGGFGAGTSTLNYLGENSAAYIPHYTLKHSERDQPWEDLITVTRALETQSNIDSLGGVLDIDESLWFLAKEILFGDDDSYVNKGGMDYYAYFDVETGRLSPLEYDANSVMTGQTSSWDLFLKENDIRFPLCNKLFKIPALRQRYLAHLRTLVNELFNPAVYNAFIDKYYNLIDTLVQKDPKKLMTYAQFQAGRQSLKSWMDARRSFILNHSEIKQTGVEITSATYSTSGIARQSPNAGVRPQVTTTLATGHIASEVYVYYATGYDGSYKKILMFDDGKHEDGLAGDGTWGVSLPGQNAGMYVRFYVEALANNAARTATYYPQGAEHDVLVYRVNLVSSQISDIVINEVMSANKKSVADQDGEFDDWIELYNRSTATIDLSRWILTDNPANLDKYRIPKGTSIAPNSYLIVWADEDGKQKGLHANFKLSSAGEPLLLMDSAGLQVDMVQIPALGDDVAYARQPNGTGPFVIKAHTFNKNNDESTTRVQESKIDQLTLFPNPVSSTLTIDLNQARAESISIFNLAGQKMFSKKGNKETIDVSQWPRGIYLLNVSGRGYKIAVF